MLVAFVLHPVLGYEPSVVALLGAGLLVAVTRVTTEEALQDVEWATLAFFMGLFVMVGGLVNTGVLDALSESIAGIRRGRTCWRSPACCCGAPALLSGDRRQHPLRGQHELRWSPSSSARTGSRRCCGGRSRWAPTSAATPPLIGASANVVVAGIAARNDRPIGFWQFTRYGLVVTAATLLLASGYLWLRYFVLAG